MENVLIVLLIVVGLVSVVFILNDNIRSIAINVLDSFGLRINASPSGRTRRRRGRLPSRNIDHLRADEDNEVNMAADNSQIIDTQLGKRNIINIGSVDKDDTNKKDGSK